MLKSNYYYYFVNDVIVTSLSRVTILSSSEFSCGRPRSASLVIGHNRTVSYLHKLCRSR